MISINMEGVKDAIDSLKEMIIPWRRKHAERIVKLDIATRQAQINQLNAETTAQKAKIKREEAAIETDKAQAELLLSQAKKAEAEAETLRTQAKKTLAEAEKEREILWRGRVELAISIVDKYAPDMDGSEKVDYVTRLLSDGNLDRLISSNIKLIND